MVVPQKLDDQGRPLKLDDLWSSPKIGRPKVGPKNRTTEGRSQKLDDRRSLKLDDRRPLKMDDRRSVPKTGRPKVGPKNWTTEGRPIKMDDLWATNSGLTWPEGPVQQDQTGPKVPYIRTKLARRASRLRLNCPKAPVQHYQGQ